MQRHAGFGQGFVEDADIHALLLQPPLEVLELPPQLLHGLLQRLPHDLGLLKLFLEDTILLLEQVVLLAGSLQRLLQLPHPIVGLSEPFAVAIRPFLGSSLNSRLQGCTATSLAVQVLLGPLELLAHQLHLAHEVRGLPPRGIRRLRGLLDFGHFLRELLLERCKLCLQRFVLLHQVLHGAVTFARFDLLLQHGQLPLQSLVFLVGTISFRGHVLGGQLLLEFLYLRLQVRNLALKLPAGFFMVLLLVLCQLLFQSL
mmetsp:Transcript_88670/g.211728  ORF Transcript_88670/g.211728 Transcript_88670/m.211728 type:complete len:257 (+) Transcript_88670:1464-2234(+)